jgi:hypothetical protein
MIFYLKLARGPACLRRTPRFSHQPACKPGSVGHRLPAQAIRDGHSSGTTFARCLEQPTRTASLTSPCGVIAHGANDPAMPSLFGLAPGVVCHAVSVAGPAVRSYRTFSPLLPLPLSVSRKRGRVGWGKRFVLCGTIPGVAPAGRYPAPYVDGARTFLSSHLSVIAGAAVRPTDPLVMGAQGCCVKPITPIAALKINYPEDVVLRFARSTEGRQVSQSKSVNQKE